MANANHSGGMLSPEAPADKHHVFIAKVRGIGLTHSDDFTISQRGNMHLEEAGTGPKEALGDCSCSLVVVWRGVCCMLSGLILSIISRIRTAVRIRRFAQEE